MKKRTFFLPLSLVSVVPLFLVATKCKDPWRNFAGVNASLKDPKKPLKDITEDDIEFKFNDASQASQYEILSPTVTKDLQKGTLTIKYYVKNKSSSVLSEEKSQEIKSTAQNGQGEQPGGGGQENTDPNSQINQDAKKVKFNLESGSEDLLPSEVDDESLEVKDLDTSKYEIAIQDLKANDSAGTIIISFIIRNKQDNSESTVHTFELKLTLKNEIDREARKVEFELKEEKDPDETLPSQVKNEDLVASLYDESLYKVEIISLTPKDVEGELDIKFKLVNIKTNEQSEETIFTLAPLKTS
ncbi:lipoprotein 17-related variable surface protein [Metamycoplasma hyosynoviae]|uniref:Lipoprotein 17-related variable surface protein n=1 Tax=Metamycoplasma hyosynoviae TaxID=29559 RepID=A0A9Q9BYR5_9BACT|nr:lipoprotein 17-related variable surface protein [Metamycoplasma hyosynoviae]MDC8916169.1 lipoprotein 17-related variable surface protein [Metamycoplasma hyosynoviae]MDD1358618.1 lipoprotein 17-related variable surface protein [Metamycoplasma hyosynoviae]MDD1361318.1 lipoprotein 17-related variable surface protein [Metamycoplasma hyosynoviae]UTO25821.1 lipoprotein 17-related variable surface protein [Metamycoplasma hyosynoviae]UTO26492.1 lipoprotein 17-related variable surface protein [Metam